MTGSYNAAGSLVNFNGSQADGNWTLFFADLANGGGTSLVEGWSLNITAVPEPVNLSLAIFGGGMGIFALRRFIIPRKSVGE